MSQFDDGKFPDRPPQSRVEVVTLAMIALFFGGMILATILKDFSVYKASILFFALSWAILLVIHEFGHALMARALGWSVKKVCIGTGRLIREQTILGMPTEFRAIPVSGFMVPRPADLIHPRLKEFLIFAAGPGVELALAGVITLLVGPEQMFSRQPEWGLVAAQSFCAAAALGALINLVPLPHDTGGGKSPSDGLGMILAWSIPDEQFEKWMRDED